MSQKQTKPLASYTLKEDVIESVQLFFTPVLAIAHAFKSAVHTPVAPKDGEKPRRTAKAA
jgi:hypothetical protein